MGDKMSIEIKNPKEDQYGNSKENIFLIAFLLKVLYNIRRTPVRDFSFRKEKGDTYEK